MTVELAFARLTEATAHAAEVRSVLLVNLLRRPGVLDFLAGYSGDPSPTRVAEAASTAGLELDNIDSALLTLAVGPGPGAPPARRSGPVARFLGASWSEVTPAQRWRDMSFDDRVAMGDELMGEPEIAGFTRRYRGSVEPERLLEGARNDGILLLSDEAVVTLAVLMGWDPCDSS